MTNPTIGKADNMKQLKDYVVRYEQIYSTVIRATSEEEACAIARKEDFCLDETTDYEAEAQE